MALVYTEKGAGLHDAISAAGYIVYWLDGVFVTPNPDDEPAIQAIIDGYSLDDARDRIKAQIEAHAAEMRNKVTAAYSPAEMASWPIKVAEANAFNASGNTADAQHLTTEANARGVALAELVAKVLANGAQLSQLEAMIAGVDGRHRDALDKLAAFADVLAYNWSTGWPEV